MKQQLQVEEDQEAEATAATASASASVFGDLLERIFSNVSLVDLVPACHVSTSWNAAVHSSLRNFNKIKPWLMVHTQRTRFPHATTTHAYDPRSRVWIEMKQPPVKFVSALRSSHSTLLYMLSPSGFSFSLDPLNMSWHDLDPPRVWRTDPIVALIKHYVLIAGGTCEFEDDPYAVEIHDIRTRTWERCDSMPLDFEGSASSTWQSVAVDSENIYIMEKHSGVMHSFDPQNKTWRGPYDLRSDPNVFFSVITFANSRLILAGLLTGGVKLWEVLNYDEPLKEFKEIGEMPTSEFEKLKGNEAADDDLSAVAVASMEEFVYLYNESNPEEVVVCEINGEGKCRWSSIKNVVVNDETRILDRFVFTCSKVGMADLQRAAIMENRSFNVKVME